jgi:hypothetical protein
VTEQTLASAITCKHCTAPVYVVYCRDGRYRIFDRTLLPAGTPGVWAWRKHEGMEETDRAPGYGLHYCLGHHGHGLDHRAFADITALPAERPDAQN